MNYIRGLAIILLSLLPAITVRANIQPPIYLPLIATQPATLTAPVDRVLRVAPGYRLAGVTSFIACTPDARLYVAGFATQRPDETGGHTIFRVLPDWTLEEEPRWRGIQQRGAIFADAPLSQCGLGHGLVSIGVLDADAFRLMYEESR